MSRLKILVYEKNSHKASRLCMILESAGYAPVSAFYDREAEAVASRHSPEMAIASFDLFPLPESIRNIKAVISAPEGMFREVSETALRYNIPCLTYPYDAEAVIARVKAVLNETAAPPIGEAEDNIPEIAGISPQTESLKNQIADSARSNCSILLLGETGTGKELAARAIHRLSDRANEPFVALNCAALAEGVLESELFGHERGAFTGAIKRHSGKFETADNGTIFLDEIGDMPTALQVKLLRALEQGAFYPVGSEKEISVNVRVVAATNRNVFRMAETGSFRRDLLYRLNVITVDLPPLREREGDIEFLANMFLKGFAKKYKKEISGFSKAALEKIKAHNWPGNVRELENIVERLAVNCKEGLVEKISFPEKAAASINPPPELAKLMEMDFTAMKEEVLQHYEKEYLNALLSIEGGAIQNVAKRCGMDRKTLYRKMKQYGLDKKDFK